MCKVKKISYMSSDKMTMIHALAWIPDGEVQGILQISHGMQEFIERYDRFARFMCEHHILVVATKNSMATLPRKTEIAASSRICGNSSAGSH